MTLRPGVCGYAAVFCVRQNKGIYNVRIELSARVRDQFGNRPTVVGCGAVRAGGKNGIIGIGHGNYPRMEGDPFSGNPVGISAPIVVLKSNASFLENVMSIQSIISTLPFFVLPAGRKDHLMRTAATRGKSFSARETGEIVRIQCYN